MRSVRMVPWVLSHVSLTSGVRHHEQQLHVAWKRCQKIYNVEDIGSKLAETFAGVEAQSKLDREYCSNNHFPCEEQRVHTKCGQGLNNDSKSACQNRDDQEIVNGPRCEARLGILKKIRQYIPA